MAASPHTVKARVQRSSGIGRVPLHGLGSQLHLPKVGRRQANCDCTTDGKPRARRGARLSLAYIYNMNLVGTLNHHPLNLVEGQLIIGSVVELHFPLAFVSRYLLSLLVLHGLDGRFVIFVQRVGVAVEVLGAHVTAHLLGIVPSLLHHVFEGGVS